MKRQSHSRKGNPAKKSTVIGLKTVCLLTLAVALGGPNAKAALAYDGFDYTTGGKLNTGSGGSGWSGNWVASTGTGPIDYTIVPGLGMGRLAVTGNAVAFSNTGSSYDNGARRLLETSLQVGQEVWMSFLFQLDTIDTTGASIHLGLTDGSGTGTAGSRHVAHPVNGGKSQYTTVTYGQHGSNSVEVANRIRDNLGTTYLLVANMTIGGDASVSLWVMDSTVFANLAEDAWTNNAGIITQAMLDAQVPADWRVTASSSVATTILPTHIHTALYQGMTGVFDEVRLGTTSWDVLPLIPEPASILFLTLGSLAILHRRR